MTAAERTTVRPEETTDTDGTADGARATSDTPGRREDDYTIRPYHPDDRDGFLALHETVFGGGSPDWFAWKYEDNPYLEDVSIFVATADDEIVGARPYLGFRMRAGDNTYVGVQTADTMVHPDHRRRGLFARMTERSLEHYADGEPAFMFNVPNAISRAGYLDLGCEIVSELTTRYRLQNPAAFADLGGVLGRIASLSGPLARGYHAVSDATIDVPADVTVVEHVDIPAETLASLYRRRPSDAIHALRDEQFFEYRFENPEWEYTAYTARLGETPVAGLVTGTRTDGGQTVTTLVDVVPLVGDAERDRALVALLDRVLRDHRDSDIVANRGSAIPDRILSQFGFLSDRSLPLSLVASPTVAIAAPIPVDGSWRIAGRDLRDPSNWAPTFAEHNTR